MCQIPSIASVVLFFWCHDFSGFSPEALLSSKNEAAHEQHCVPQ